MEEAISHGLSTMLPLLGMLAVVFGGLIAVALVLRIHMRRQMNASGGVAATSVIHTKEGDLISVLGRTFTVDDVSRTDGEEGFVWVCLSSGESSARLAFGKAGDLALSFPGKPQPVTEPEGFPSSMSFDDRGYLRASLGQLGTGEQGVVLYTGDSGFWLALEKKPDSMLVWRGKEIPTEGVSVLQDQD